MSQRTLGAIVDTHSIEQAIVGILLPSRNLLGVWMDEVSRQQPQDNTVRIERPRTVKARWTISRFVEDQLPALLLLNGGTPGTPYRDSEGRYQATWSMVIAAVAQGTDENVTRGIASRMSRAAMGVIASSLAAADGRIGSVLWAGEEDPIDMTSGDRTRCAFGQRFTVTVGDILCDLAGLPVDWDEPDPPIGQPALDPGELGSVQSAAVVSAVPVDEPV